MATTNGKGGAEAASGASPALLNSRTSAQWAQEIDACYRKAVRSVIELGELLLGAKAELGARPFSAMVKRDLSFGERAAYMYMAIAKNSVLTDLKHVSKLPASWGTLHALAKLPEDVLRKKIEDGTITPQIMRRQVAALLPAPKITDAELRAIRRPKGKGKAPTKSRAQRWHDAMSELGDAVTRLWVAAECFADACRALNALRKEGGETEFPALDEAAESVEKAYAAAEESINQFRTDETEKGESNDGSGNDTVDESGEGKDSGRHNGKVSGNGTGSGRGSGK